MTRLAMNLAVPWIAAMALQAWTIFPAAAQLTEALPLEQIERRVDQIAQPLIDNESLVGCVVGVLSSGETIVQGFGEVARGSGAKPDGKTVYEIGSISKALTGTLLADLAERSVLSVDDELQAHLPKGSTAPERDEQPITLAHLATHTSGLPRMPANLQPSDPMNPYADYDAKRALEFLSQHNLQRLPGEKYEYSNYAAGLLGYVLARAEDVSYEQLLVDRICEPLKMHDTHIALTPELQARLAPPYDGGLNENRNWDLNVLVGAGGVRSTVDDMLKLAAAALAEDDDSRPVVEALHQAMQHRHGKPGEIGMGLGWHRAVDGVTWWHNGQTGGYSGSLFIYPPAKLAVVVLSNTATQLTTTMGEKIVQAALGIDVDPIEMRQAIDVDPEILATYVGKYALSLFFVLDVTLEDGKLMVQATRQPKFQIFPESETDFYYKVVDAQITFHRDEQGEVEKLTLHQNGQDLPGLRVPEVQSAQP